MRHGLRVAIQIMPWTTDWRRVHRHRSTGPPEGHIMAEATTIKPKAKPAATPFADVPKFEMPKLEIPAAFREFAEKGVSQAKDNWEKMKAVTEEATDVLEDSYATASKGAADYGVKLIDATRTNTNAYFDFATQFLTVKSLSEA